MPVLCSDSSSSSVEPVRSSVLAGRLAFVDYARAAATLMMVLGHTVDALLAPAYRATPLFHGWTSIRGLTASTFLLVSGFAFGCATLGNSPIGIDRSRANRRFRRGLLLILCGYALHFPAANVWRLSGVADDAWRSFLAVDILQTIGITLICLQAIALAAPSPRRFMAVTLAVATVVCVSTPAMWTARGSATATSVIEPYLSAAGTGSLFPLFPWLAYGTAGAALSAWFLSSRGETPAARAWRTLLPAGAVAFAVALVCRLHSWEPVGGPNLGAARVSQFLLQAGSVCLLVAGLAAAVDAARPQPMIVQALARHSLLVYGAHLCIVYGSPWNAGLRQFVGMALSPGLVAGCVVALWTMMIALSVWWRLSASRYPLMAIRLRASVVAILLLAFLL